MVPQDDDLWNEAMALLLAWVAAPDDRKQREAVLAFCARGEAHRRAWEEAKQVYHLTGAAAIANKPRPRRRNVTRRAALAGLGAALLGAGALRGPAIWRDIRSDLATATGEIRSFDLAGGKRLTLGPYSSVRLDLTGAVSRIELLDGMVLCETAGEPVALLAGTLAATGGDCVFEARWTGGRALIGVADGVLDVTAVGASGDTAALGADEWIATGPAEGELRRGVRETGQTASWRDRLLVADGDAVGAIAAEIGQWYPGRIVIPQASLASAPVSGLFDVSDPQAALAVLVAPHGGTVSQVSPWLTILSTI